jgi:four helix bundle protein
MTRSTFHDLEVYALAVELADDLYSLVARWPNFDRFSIGSQLVRSADSVGANIAEATGRWHPKDRQRLLYIARGSLSETEHRIACAERRGLLTAGTAARAERIARPLNGLISSQR